MGPVIHTTQREFVIGASPERQQAVPRVRYWQLALVGAVLLAAAGHLFIKAGLNTAVHLPAHSPLWSRLVNCLQPEVLLGLFIYGIGTAMWVFAVSRQEISFLYPVTALNYVVIAVAGHILFAEEVSVGRWLGILVVVCGVVLMHSSRKEA